MASSLARLALHGSRASRVSLSQRAAACSSFRAMGPLASSAASAPARSSQIFARAMNTGVPPPPQNGAQIPGFEEPPKEVTLNQAIAVGETVLMYLEQALPGKQLDQLYKEKSKSSVVTRMRKMLGLYIGTQLYVLGPFGFQGSQEGLEQFARLQMQMLQGKSPEMDEVQELRKLSSETWSIMVQRAFGIKVIPELTQDQVRFAASRVSSNLQDPTFLKMVEDTFKNEIQPLAAAGKQEEAIDKLQEAMIPCYINVLQTMNVESLPPTDEGYVLLQVCMNQNMGDPAVAQAIMSGFGAVQARAPIGF